MSYRIILFIVAISLISCSEDFLDRNLKGELELVNFMKTKNDVILATDACYNGMRDWRYWGGFPFLEILTDDATKGSNPSDGSHLLPIENFSFLPTSEHVSALYQTEYATIRRANLVIEKSPDIDMDETLKNRLVGEARFIRAISYFHLVRAYGGTPLVETIEPPRILPRNTDEEIYSLIASDLEKAIEGLPLQSEYGVNELGRVSRGAAKALLSKVYLYQGDFINAEKYALEVINSAQYSLDPDFSNSFSVFGEYGTGSIFELGAIGEGSKNLGGHQYANTQAVRGVPNRGWGFNRPSIELINFFLEREDPRLDATAIFLGETLDGVFISGDSQTPDTTYDDSGNISAIECYNQKVWTPGTSTDDSWGHNIRVLRYAEVLLIAAESLNENDKSSQALPYLNLVRERARGSNSEVLPDITSTDQDELRDIIFNERRAELAMEQNRFFDLVRTGRAGEVLGPLGFETGKHELLPIPQSEIDLSEGTLEQNPGW